MVWVNLLKIVLLESVSALKIASVIVIVIVFVVNVNAMVECVRENVDAMAEDVRTKEENLEADVEVALSGLRRTPSLHGRVHLLHEYDVHVHRLAVHLLDALRLL